jgi:Ubiquitin-conjugating enzyme
MSEHSTKATVEGDSNHTTTSSPEPYGSSLSHIRETDKAAIEEINQLASRDLIMSNRIFRELQLFHESPSTPYLSITPIADSLDNCLASVEGPSGTPYAGGIFWLHIAFPANYPGSPLLIRFVTPILHPNIDEEGRICLNILSQEG